MTKPGDYVICVDAVDANDGLKPGETYQVSGIDRFGGGIFLYELVGPAWKPKRFTPAPSYEQLLQQRDELLAFAKDCEANWDCDSDGHKYGTGCRCCNARVAIASVTGGES